MHAVLVLALVIAPAPVGAEPASAESADTVEDPAARAAKLFGAGEFIEAADAFEEAFAKTGDPAFVFGRAQALRRAGNCAAAIDEFERFIALSPPQSDVDAANEAIGSCRRVLGIAASADDPVPPPQPVRDAPPPEPPKRPWHRDPAGAALLGGGLVVAALGSGLVGGSYARARDRSDESEAAYDSRKRSVANLNTAGIVALSTGGALLIASIIRYALVARRGRTSTTAAASPLTLRF